MLNLYTPKLYDSGCLGSEGGVRWEGANLHKDFGFFPLIFIKKKKKKPKAICLFQGGRNLGINHIILYTPCIF